MKPLILLDSLAMGGSERKGVRLANEFAARGNPVVLSYLRDPEILLPQIDEGIPVKCLQRRGRFSPRALRNLQHLISEHDISVVLCMNLYPLLYAALLKVFGGHGTLKIILAINTTEFERRRDRWFMYIYAPLIRRIEAVIYGCRYQMQLWQERYRLRGVHSMVLYNGVDTSAFDPAAGVQDMRSQLSLGSAFVIGSIGRMDPEKNHAILLDVLARLRARDVRCELVLAGDGPERNRLEVQAGRLGIRQQVHFLGRVTDVRAALKTMDAFVLPSVSVETFSNAALEAMAMSLPVVLSNVAGAAEMVTDGDSGFLYERRDHVRLETLLLQLIGDPGLCRRLGQRAREIVLDRFDQSRMVDQYASILAAV